MKIKYILILMLLLTGCRSKKIVSEDSNREVKDSIVQIQRVTDTVFKDRIIEKTKPVYYEVAIQKPCDSLGNLISFDYKVGSGSNTSRIYTKDGKLYLNTYIDSLKNVYEKDYRARWAKDSLALHSSLISEQSSSEEIVRYIYPWWLWLAIIGGVLFGILYLIERFDVITRIRKAVIKI